MSSEPVKYGQKTLDKSPTIKRDKHRRLQKGKETITHTQVM